jgi:hypothetical protein
MVCPNLWVHYRVTTSASFSVLLNNVIFVTSSTWNGNLGGFAGANTKCNADANKPSGNAAGAGKTYKALLNGNNATTNGVTYYRTDGINSIATATGGNLVGANSLERAIKTGTAANPWTGANSSTNCSNWASSSGTGTTGISNSVTSTWWSAATPTCDASRGLYCVAQ